MKRNYSLPKMNMIEISNKLNRLKARNKPRLQFPKHIESRKHYFDHNADNVVLGQDNMKTSQVQRPRRNNLDVSDIEGAKPKIIQKQKNVLHYYQNKNNDYNPFQPKQFRLVRSNSDHRISQRVNQPVTDSLDKFQRQLQRKLIMNPQNKRQVTEPISGINYDYHKLNYDNKTNNDQTINKNNMLNKKLGNANNNYAVYENYSHKVSNSPCVQRKSLVYNPTFMSQLFLY